MKSSTCHNIYSYCLAVLVCFLLSALFGCDEKVTPPAKPSVIKKRIEQDRPETITKKAVEEEAASEPSQSPDSMSGTEPAPGPETLTPEVVKKQEEKAAQVSEKEVVFPAKEVGQTKDQTKDERSSSLKPEEGLAPQKTVAAKKSSLKTSIPDETWRYDPVGKIDPFAALFKDDGDTRQKKKDKLTRPLTPLEKIDLSQLKLVAIIRTETTSRAMVEDAAGKGYVISIGTRMGTHSGKVVKIFKDRVAIQEEMEDFLGRTKKAKRELRLQKPSGEE